MTAAGKDQTPQVDPPAMRRRVLRIPVLGFILFGPFLLAPLVVAGKAMSDPFAGSPASVAFQWLVTGVFSLAALAVIVSMLRSRFVVEWDAVARVRGLGRKVTVGRDDCRRITVAPSDEQRRFDDRRQPPRITVTGQGGREVVSAGNEAEADAVLPVLLDWILDRPSLARDAATSEFFASYERHLAGEVVKHPYL